MKCAECNKEASYCIEQAETNRMGGFITAWKFLCKQCFKKVKEEDLE